MNQAHIKEIRELANHFSAEAIENCMQLALEGKENPCFQAGKLEEMMNVLAKASFVREQIEQGSSLGDAIRELGKRMRAAQRN